MQPASPFGQQPAAAQPTSPFGASPAPFGAAPRPAFGASPTLTPSSSAFGGGTTTAFGSAPTPVFGGSPQGTGSATAFGSTTTATPFGSTQNTSSAFGARPTTGFGSVTPQAPGFGSPGATASPFGMGAQAGGAGGAFGSSSPAFGQQTTTTSSVFGGGAGAFGQSAATAVGTKQVPYQVTQENEASGNSSTVVKYQTITFMPSYRGKSVEELRFEDYQNGVKGGQGVAMGQGAGGFGFNQGGLGTNTATPAGGAFGMNAGSQMSSLSSPFGAASQPAFGMGGGSLQTSTPGAFGAAGGGAFGAQSSPAFGAATTTTSPTTTGGFGFGSPAQSTPAFSAAGGAGAFGQQPSTGAFGQPAAGAGSSLFGAAPTAGASTTSQPFGSTFGGASTGGAFGAAKPGFAAPSSTPAFGASSTPAFGAAASTPAFSLGGASSTPAFGASAAPAQPSFGGFGAAPASQPAFGLGSTPAFGSTAATPPTPQPSFGGFGTTAPSTTTGGFSLNPLSTPALGGGGLFGNTATATTTSTFGASPGSQPAPSTSLFGMSQPATSTTPSLGLLGGTQTTTPSTSLFGGGGLGGAGGLATTPTFGGLGGLLTPGTTGIANVTTAPQSPYGGLPPTPTTTAGTPTATATLATRQAPQRTSTTMTTATNLMSPRTIVPRSTIRIRPRRGKDSLSPQSAGKGSGSGGTPRSFFYTADDDADTGAGNVQSMMFKARDDPRKLFLKKKPANGSAAGGGAANGSADRDGDELSLQLPDTSPGATAKAARAFAATASQGGDYDRQSPQGRKDGNGMTTPRASRGGIRLASDAANDGSPLANLVPYLSPESQKNGYYTIPRQETLTQMARTDPDALSRVSNFVVGRDGYGKCRWKGKVDVRGLNVSDIVTFESQDSKAVITVYPEGGSEKPSVGSGLNRPAEVTLYDVFVIKEGAKVTDGPLVDKFTKRLKTVPGTTFVKYGAEEGEWIFEVEHFSRYGVPDDDDDDEQEAEEKEKENQMGTAVPTEMVTPIGVAAAVAEDMEDAMEADEYEEYDMNALRGDMRERLSSPLMHTLPRTLGLDASEMYTMRAAMFEDATTAVPSMPTREHESNGGGGTDWEARGWMADMNNDGVQSGYDSGARTTPRKIVPSPPLPTPTRRVFDPTHYEDETRGATAANTHSSNVVDAGLFMGQSFRVGWGPGGVLFHYAAPQTAATTRGVRNSSSEGEGIIQTRRVVPRAVAVPGGGEIVGKFLQTTAEVHMSQSKRVMEADDVPRWEVLASPSSLVDVCKEFVERWKAFVGTGIGGNDDVMGIDPRVSIRTLILLKILVEEDFNDDASDVYDIIPWDLRRRARLGRWLSEWNEDALRTLVADVPDESALRVFYLLVGRFLAQASSIAAHSRDLRLATLVAQGAVPVAGRRALLDQLHIWEQEDFVPYIDRDRMRVYNLLAGRVDRAIEELPLDWRCAFAAYFWYGIGIQNSLSDAIALYDEEFHACNAPMPLPAHVVETAGGSEEECVCDIDYYLMQVRFADSKTVEAMLSPKSSSNDPLEFHLQWLLGTLLSPLDICPVDGALHSIVVGMAFQLEVLGYVEWAVYVLTTAPFPGDDMWAGTRRNAVKELVSRHADIWVRDPEKADFLVREVGIPPQWIAEAIAHLAHGKKRPDDEIPALVAANMYNEAHRLFLVSVAPKMILRGERTGAMLSFLALLEKQRAAIDDWQLGGGALLQFDSIEHRIIRGEVLEGDTHGGDSFVSNLEIDDMAMLLSRGAELWSSKVKMPVSSSQQRELVTAAFNELLRKVDGWRRDDAFTSETAWSWLQKCSGAAALESVVVANVQEAAERLCEDAAFFSSNAN